MIIANGTPLAKYTDAELRDTWAWLDTQRVKSGPNKGRVKLSAARLGDRLLSEASRRGLSL